MQGLGHSLPCCAVHSRGCFGTREAGWEAEMPSTCSSTASSYGNLPVTMTQCFTASPATPGPWPQSVLHAVTTGLPDW
jgi:hypothetical protein